MTVHHNTCNRYVNNSPHAWELTFRRSVRLLRNHAMSTRIPQESLCCTFRRYPTYCFDIPSPNFTHGYSFL